MATSFHMTSRVHQCSAPPCHHCTVSMFAARFALICEKVKAFRVKRHFTLQNLHQLNYSDRICFNTKIMPEATLYA